MEEMMNDTVQQPQLDYDRILAQYVAYRETSRKLNSKLVRHLSKDDMVAGGKTLGLIGEQGVLVFGDEDEATVLMDYCIHGILKNGKSLVDRLIEHPPSEFTSREMEVIHLLAQSEFTVFGVERTVPDVGIWARDCFHENARFLLADILFGQTATPGMHLASRVIPMDGFSITTGAALPIMPELYADIEGIVSRFQEGTPIYETGPTREQEADISGQIIRHLLKSDASSRVAYGADDDDDEFLPGMPAASSSEHGSADLSSPQRNAKIGRNTPCSCGSGKKYKKCCGRK